VSSEEPFVLINSFEVPEGSDEEFVAAWQADPGLYRVVGG
jgi:hypothetical protein